MKFKMFHENYNVQDLQKSMDFYQEAFGQLYHCIPIQRRKRFLPGINLAQRKRRALRFRGMRIPSGVPDGRL